MNKLSKNGILYRNFSYAKLRTWYANLVKPGLTKAPYKHVVQIGDPILRGESSNILPEHINTNELVSLIGHLKHVSNKYNCIGLSAPQIGIPLRIFVLEFNRKQAKKFKDEELKMKQMDLIPFTVVINPKIKVTDYNKIIHEESCESIRGFYADVPRYKSIELEALNENGEPFKLPLKGWAARVVQHEMDHLNSKLYTDIMDRKTFTCSCWQVVNERRGKVLLPFGPE